MPKTYPDVGTFTSGQILTAATMNQVADNLDNQRSPAMARITMTANVAVATGSHTDFAGFLSTNSTETFDTDGMVSLSAVASAITIQTAGIYSCTGSRFASGENRQKPHGDFGERRGTNGRGGKRRPAASMRRNDRL